MSDENKQKLATGQNPSTTSGWQTDILKFVADQVQKIHEANREQVKDLGNMKEDERHEIWAVFFRRNPLGVTIAMWKPVSSVVDFDAIIHPPTSSSDQTKAKLQLWHDYVLQCWTLTAENSFLFLILAKSKSEAIAELKRKTETEYTVWKKMSFDPRVVVPSIEDVPVAAIATRNKRRKTR
ncbi:uncharacterized protein IWZ02DRAFT_431097 [Phyllosticta citriasiana]|uniref:uncharacterized protein n=1 Tax=Phyllosticta citriasiana TaxID=595635 RepID=UPI0030FD80B7